MSTQKSSIRLPENNESPPFTKAIEMASESRTKFLQLIAAIISLEFVASCSNPETSNPDSPRIHKILFLGNSITFHRANSSLGWNGEWGMAASSEDSDYVHRLVHKIRSNYPTKSVFYRAKNIAAWEGDFSIDPHALADTTGFHPNIVIIRLGENVPDTTTPNRYFNELSKLVRSYQNDTTTVLVTGNFWASSWKDSVQYQVASKLGCPFVDFSAISSDSTHNQATGLFSNGAVARHPSDQGMRAMSDSIYSRLVSGSILR